MTNIVVEGFATYGIGEIVSSNATGVTAYDRSRALLAGVWAQLPLPTYINPYSSNNGPQPSLGQLPWAPLDLDIYASRYTVSYDGLETTFANASSFRRVLPVAADPCIASFYYAISSLPLTEAVICGFADVSNTIMAWLVITSTGALLLRNVDNTVTLAQTGGPVIVSETANHLEMEFSAVAGTFTLNVNETPVITAVGMTITPANTVAQMRFLPAIQSNISVYPTQYFSNLIIRDTIGALNNAIVGDRRVATLMVNSDDNLNQGWVAHPIKRFGVGVLRLLNGSGTAYAEYSETVAGDLQIGASDYTVEAQVRFSTLPYGTQVAASPAGIAVASILSSWEEDAPNNKDWQLYLGSIANNGGQLVMEASADGTANNVTTLFSYPWSPVIGRWYHVAVNRAAGFLTIYIDGVQLGPVVPDTVTYGYTYKKVILGSSRTGYSAYWAVDSRLWMDDVRITIGTSRYTANFTPPSVALPIGIGTDPLWASVALRTTFDDQTASDLSNAGHSNFLGNDSTVVNPMDGSFAYQTIDELTPTEDNYISADFIPATGVLTLTAIPTAADTVTVATTDGTTAAVYTWVAAVAVAYDVLIGATIADCESNLVAAINAGAGIGTTYGTATIANNDITALANPSGIMVVTANVPGTSGNAFASTATGVAATWGAVTLLGGVDIPAYSQFRVSRLPNDATQVDSVTIATRMLKTDAGIATVQTSMVGLLGGVLSGANHSISTAPTVYMDTIENDPDNPTNPLSPAILTQSLVRVNRTS